jgi:hypothetical protein
MFESFRVKTISNQKDSALERKSLSGSSWQNIAFTYDPEPAGDTLKFRQDPLYRSVKFIIFPDDTFKIVWDLVVLW